MSWRWAGQGGAGGAGVIPTSRRKEVVNDPLCRRPQGMAIGCVIGAYAGYRVTDAFGEAKAFHRMGFPRPASDTSTSLRFPGVAGGFAGASICLDVAGTDREGDAVGVMACCCSSTPSCGSGAGSRIGGCEHLLRRRLSILDALAAAHAANMPS